MVFLGIANNLVQTKKKKVHFYIYGLNVQEMQ